MHLVCLLHTQVPLVQCFLALLGSHDLLQILGTQANVALLARVDLPCAEPIAQSPLLLATTLDSRVVLLNVLFVDGEVFLHLAQLLVRLLDHHHEVLVFGATPLAQRSLHSKLFICANSLGCCVLLTTGQVLVSRKIVEHGERFLHGCLTQRVAEDIAAFFASLCV